MDDVRFDALTRAIARIGSRRAVLRVLGGAAGASLLAGLGESGASAKCKNHGRKCDKHSDCCDGRCKRGRCGCGTGGACRVFTTSEWSTAALGGLSGADSTCQRLANEAKLGGTYLAWLSDDTGSPATRFFQSPEPYVLVDGTIVANNWADLTDGRLRTRIKLDEQGGNNPGGDVWTNTAIDGSSKTGQADGPHCENWTSGEAGGPEVRTGDGAFSQEYWTDGYLAQCYFTGRLYCFEQD